MPEGKLQKLLLWLKRTPKEQAEEAPSAYEAKSVDKAFRRLNRQLILTQKQNDSLIKIAGLAKDVEGESEVLETGTLEEMRARMKALEKQGFRCDYFHKEMDGFFQSYTCVMKRREG